MLADMRLGNSTKLLLLIAITTTWVVAQDQPSQVAQPAKDKGPSYEDTVKWVQDHIGEAGFPASSEGPGKHGLSFASDDTPYTVKFDGCDMRLSIATHMHTTDSSPVGGKAENDMTADSTQSWSFGLHLGQLKFVAGAVQNLPVQLGSPTTVGNGDRNFPTIVIALPENGGGATWSQTFTDTDTSNSVAPPIVNKPLGTWWPATTIYTQGIPMTLRGIQITYARPGTEDAPQHMISALKHLIDLCKENPNAGPKDLF
jgi:hypothetical protein